MAREIRLAHVGLGPIGQNIARLALDTHGLKVAAACDPAPDKAGQDLGLLLGLEKRKRIKVHGDPDKFFRTASADIAVLTTASRMREIKPQVMALLRRGMHVVTTCEELAYPTRSHQSSAREIDRYAKKKRRAVLSTGVNPGYAMDVLPLMLTAPCYHVDRITVMRVVDAGSRRLPLQRKVGAGLSLSQFNRAATDGAVRHHGLVESAHMIAAAMGWKLEKVEESVEPVVSPRDLETEHLRIPAGSAAGIRQHVRAFSNTALVVSLDLQMYVGAEKPRDHIVISGRPPIDVTVKGGIAGDEATAAMVINCIPRLLSGATGLLAMSDLQIPHYLNPADFRAARRG